MLGVLSSGSALECMYLRAASWLGVSGWWSCKWAISIRNLNGRPISTNESKRGAEGFGRSQPSTVEAQERLRHTVRKIARATGSTGGNISFARIMAEYEPSRQGCEPWPDSLLSFIVANKRWDRHCPLSL